MARPITFARYGFCPDCGEPVHNRGAHAEACRGPQPARKMWGTTASEPDSHSLNRSHGPAELVSHQKKQVPQRCQARVQGYGHGVYRQCVRPWNHKGGCIFQ